MEQKQIIKQVTEFNKAIFDSAFSNMIVMQDQAEKMFSKFLDKAPWLPEEGKKVLDDWMNSYKKGREDFKSSVDDSYKKVTDFFSTTM